MTMTASGIELKNVTIGFGSEVLLSQVYLSISPGERVVLIGPSGQGKSVLLKLMGGLLEPTQGEVWVDGKNLQETTGLDRLKLIRKMGMLFQKNALFDSLSVAENVAFPLRETALLPESEIQKKVHYFLSAVGLLQYGDSSPDKMSGGMQKRLGIARALALDPQFILYDDPTAGLDPVTSRKIIDLILELQRKANSTVVAITHDMARAYQLAHRIVYVDQGEILVTGSVEETRRHPDPRVHRFIRGESTHTSVELRP